MNLRTDPLTLPLRPAVGAAAAPEDGEAVWAGLPRHDARALTRGGVQARIVLDGQVYCLRITRAGKLILTK